MTRLAISKTELYSNVHLKLFLGISINYFNSFLYRMNANISDCKTILPYAYKIQGVFPLTERRILNAFLKEKIGTINFIFLNREFY